MSKKPSVSMLNLVSAALMLVLLILQFTPFWHFDGESEQSSSIQSYVWFPEDHKELDSYLSESCGVDYSLNSIVAMPVLVLVLGAVGVVLCIMKGRHWATALLPAACGLVGTWGYLSRAAYHLGSGWGFHLVLCIAVLILGVSAAVLGVRETA